MLIESNLSKNSTTDSLKNYKMLGKLGKGKFATVYCATNNEG